MTKLFSLLYQGSVHPASLKKIIPAEEYMELVSAAEILEKAKEDVATYRKEAEDECARLKEEAKQAGFDEGLAQFNEQLLLFERSLRELRLQLQKQVLPLALKAAKKIIGKELETHPEVIVDIVLQTLAPVTQNFKVTIFVNKVDKEILETNKPKLKSILEQVRTLIIQDRDDISPGGCVIETETGIINATIETQWRALETVFEKYMHSHPNP